MAIQSSASTKEIQQRMVKYPDFLKNNIDLVLGRDNVQRMKPAPDGILLAAERFNVPPSHCIFIGDMGDGYASSTSGGGYWYRSIDRV